VFCSVPIGISYDSDIDKARAILLELARQHPQAREVSGARSPSLGPLVWCLLSGPGALTPQPPVS
jgi:small-conductance mechanosensitive channel